MVVSTIVLEVFLWRSLFDVHDVRHGELSDTCKILLGCHSSDMSISTQLRIQIAKLIKRYSVRSTSKRAGAIVQAVDPRTWPPLALHMHVDRRRRSHKAAIIC